MAWSYFFALGWMVCLLYAGGFTTSIKAGMAFLDWPLSNGSLNPEGWMQHPDQLAEHSHRLLGMVLGLLALILFMWTWLRESRTWVRALAGGFVLLVILQGLLGGVRVLFDWQVTHAAHNALAQTFAVLHACGAALLLCLLVSLVVVNSRSWIEYQTGLETALPSRMRRWGFILCLLIFLQLIVGAVMRHYDAALAIPTFPLTPEGTLLPHIWNLPIAVHFIHRIGALAVCLVLLIFIGHVVSYAPTRQALGKGIFGLVLLVGLQIFLGALVIWTVKNPYAATIHSLLGALLLACAWTVTLWMFRHRIA